MGRCCNRGEYFEIDKKKIEDKLIDNLIRLSATMKKIFPDSNKLIITENLCNSCFWRQILCHDNEGIVLRLYPAVFGDYKNLIQVKWT